MSMKDKICIVTGANSGIGKVTARVLVERGAHVVLACRNPTRGEAALAEIREATGSDAVELMTLDLASLASIRAFKETFADRHDRLDVLVNNAGAYIPTRQETADGFELTIGVNHLGPFLLTELLIDALKATSGGRVVNVSSMGHKMAKFDLDDLHSTRKYRALRVYCNSKLANIHHAAILAKRLAPHGITANSLHPGAIASGFAQQEKSAFGLLVKIGKPFLLSSEKGARTQIYLATSPDVANISGEYFVRNRPAKPSRAGRDMVAAERLWELSERAVGLA